MSHHDHHEHAEHHGLGHVVPVKVLLAVFATLIVLTGITVGVRMIDLGSPWNLLVAMLIATIKASLVCAYFMHLRYDKLMHTIMLLSAVAFFTLFIGFALMDRGQYEHDVRWNQNESPHPF